MESISDKTIHLKELIDSLSDIYSCLKSKGKLEHYSELLYKHKSKMRALLKEIQRPGNLQVSVVGNFNSGKSSFINSLIGRKVCEFGINPTTSSVTRYSKGDTEQIYQLKEKGSKEMIPRKKFWELTSHNNDKNENFYEFEYLLPDFPFNDIELLDTPGFENPKHPEDDENTMSIAIKTDIILFLVNIDQGNPNDSMLAKIKKLTKENSKKCFLIFNHADRKSPGGIETIINDTKKNYGTLFSGIFIYSSKYKEENEDRKKYFEKKKEVIKSEIEKFVDLKNSIYASKYNRDFESVYTEVMDTISEVENKIVTYYSKLSSKTKKCKQNLLKLQNMNDDFKKNDFITDLTNKINNKCRNCLNFVEIETSWYERRRYKWIFIDDKFFLWLDKKICDSFNNVQDMLELESINMIGSNSRVLTNKIDKEIESWESFTDSVFSDLEFKENFSEISFEGFIYKIVFEKTIFPIIESEIKKQKKEIKEVSYFEEIISLINNSKNYAEQLK